MVYTHLLEIFAAALVLSGFAAGLALAKGEKDEGCVKPAKGPVVNKANPNPAPEAQSARAVRAQVGKPAPDFEANAYVDGSFKNIKLSDYRGKWVILCFYPADFTFV